MPYRGYAYSTILGAVLMSCRRKAYREATHEPLQFEKANNPGESRKNIPVDERPRVDQEMLVREEQKALAGSRLYVQRLRLLMAVSRLPVFERDVVRQVLAGADIEELEREAPGAKRRLMAAVPRLKRVLAPPHAAGSRQTGSTAATREAPGGPADNAGG